MNSTEPGVQASEFQPALAARFYASESVFALERERLFHAQWFCVGRAEQVPTRGECLHVHVAGESMLILRQKDDSLRAFYNVCRHRGSRLVRTPPSAGSGPAVGHPIDFAVRGRRVSLSRVDLQPGRVAARGTLRAVRFHLPEGRFLTRAGPPRHLGRLHIREPFNHADPVAARTARGARAQAGTLCAPAICVVARSASTTCAPTGK